MRKSGKSKVCSKCKQDKLSIDFYPDNRKARLPNSLRPTCKKCDIMISNLWASKNKEYVARRIRNWRLGHYGLDTDSFNAMLSAQGGVCASCGTDNPRGSENQWNVDHDHSCCSGKDSCGKCIRGILCASCNRALGIVGDSIQKLQHLINYLRK